MLRIAVFGCGYWAAFQVAAWQARGAQVVAVWNRTRARADAFASKFSIPRVFDTPEQVFDWGAFDIADIIADVGAHKPLTLLAAQRGKPVICQKPMAYTLSDCEEMVEACRSAGVWFAVHENFRYQPPTEAFIRAVRSGRIGKVLHAQLNLRSPDLDILQKQPALRTMPHMALRDMGPHIFDVARAAFGEFSSLYAAPVYSYRASGVEVPDAALCTLVSREGAAVACHLVHQWNDRMMAQGERGRVTLDHDNVLRIETEDGCETCDTKGWPVLPYIPREDWDLHGGHVMSAIPRCLADLTDSFTRGVPAPTSGADNLETMRLVFAAIESFDTGRAVTLQRDEART
jgi:predicted dehydrogenase